MSLRPAMLSTKVSVACEAHQLRTVANHRSAPPAPAPGAREFAVFRNAAALRYFTEILQPRLAKK